MHNAILRERGRRDGGAGVGDSDAAPLDKAVGRDEEPCNVMLQVRRQRRGGAGGSDCEAAGLDEERDLLGVRGLLQEGSDGLLGRVVLSNDGQGRQSLFIGDCGVGASLEEMGNEGARC